MRPTPSRSSVAKSISPSSRDSRTPARTFSQTDSSRASEKRMSLRTLPAARRHRQENGLSRRSRLVEQVAREPERDLREHEDQDQGDDLDDHEVAHPPVDRPETPLRYYLLEVVRRHGDGRREIGGLEIDGDERAEPEHVVLQRLDDRVED